jgi:PKD repeat protein
VSLRVEGEKGQSDVKTKPDFVVVSAGSAPWLGVQWIGGRAVLSVSGVVGKTYRIESAPTVGAGAVWQTAATLTLSNSVQSWTDGRSGTQGARYYRAVSP